MAPQAEQLLQSIFGDLPFTKRNDILEVRRFDTNHSYCLNEAEHIIGLACIKSAIQNITLPVELKHLQYLNISDNEKLVSIQLEEGLDLPVLDRLDLSGNALQQLDLVTDLGALTYLDISRNQLSQLRLPHLPKLTFLELSGNQLTELSLSTPNLLYAYLVNNQLTKLELPNPSEQLEILQLRNNQLEDLPDNFLDLTGLKALYVYGNPLSNIPRELVAEEESESSLVNIWNYLIKLKEANVENDRAKLIIVGNGRVGKTSLFRRLGGQPFRRNEQYTHGVSLGFLEKDDLPEVQTDNLKVQVWDFGGQEIFYATHQFFLSDEAIYILAWTDKKNVIPHRERDKSTLPYDEKWRSCTYWLENIRLRAESSPILMVQTHSDIRENYQLSDAAWQAAPYKAINLDFSALKDYGLPQLRDLLTEHLNTNFPMLGKRFPRSYYNVIQSIEALKENKNTISKPQFLALCAEEGIEQTIAETSVLDYLIKIGVVVHFADKALLDEILYINPNWLTKEVYKLINNKLENRQGKIDEVYLQEILPNQLGYNEKKRAQFIELLKKFELIFQPEGVDYFIAPQYLPNQLDTIQQDFHDMILDDLSLGLVFRFSKFLPDNVMINFLSRYGPFSKRIYWKNGICFSDQRKSKCIVHFQEGTKSLQVYSRKDEYGLSLLREICQAFVELSRNANAEISLDGNVYIEWQKLQQIKENAIQNPAFEFFGSDGKTLLQLKDFIFLLEERPLFFREKLETKSQIDIQPQSTMNDEIVKLITKSQLDEAAKELYEIAPESYQEEVIQIQQRLNQLNREVRLGIIDYGSANTQRNKITHSLLELLKVIEEPTQDKPEQDEVGPKQRSNEAPSGAKIYFSYAWGDEGDNLTDLVNQLYGSLISDGFKVLRDNMDLEYGGLISQFMDELGKGDLIVVFISDKYAKSPYCMYELYEIARNSRWDRQVFKDRILPIPIERIRFDKPSVLDPYFDHWENEEQEWKQLIEKRIDRVSKAQTVRYHNTKAISQKFGELSDWLIDINSSSIELLSENDFRLVKNAIKSRIAQLNTVK